MPPAAQDYRRGNHPALEWILDQYREKKSEDPTIRDKFDTYRFADYKEKVIDLLMRVLRAQRSAENRFVFRPLPWPGLRGATMRTVRSSAYSTRTLSPGERPRYAALSTHTHTHTPDSVITINLQDCFRVKQGDT